MKKESISFKTANLIFILSLFFPLLHFWGKGRMFIIPVFLFFTGINGFILFSKRKLISSIFLINLIIQVFILLLLLQFYYKWDLEIIPYVFLLALFLFYKIAITFLSAKENSNQHIQIMVSYGVIVSMEIFFFALSKKIAFLKFIPNESIFSILIAAQLVFITPYFKNYIDSLLKNKKQVKIFLICFILFCYCLLFYTKGRAGILGFTVAQGILNYNYFKVKAGYFKGIIFSFFLIFVLISFKSDSSSGRLLIYRVIIAQLEPKELITGIGYGKFKVKYNELQAEYFSKKSIDSNEALLASNTYYAFNDPFQLLIETGLIGLIILLFLLIKFFVLLRRNYIFLNAEPILNGAYLSVISIIISSLFSYPFQILSILLHFLFCIAIIINQDSTENLSVHPAPLQHTHTIVSRVSLLSLAVCLVFLGIESFRFYLKLNEAIKYSNIGFRKKAILTYSKISDNSIEDRDILYNYADELAKINKIDSALIVLEKSSNYLNNDKTAILMGDLLKEKGMFPQAENQYKKAIFINPKLFSNRASLFKFYCETKQFEKAVYWGNSISKMPIKIPSKTVTDIRNETRKLMLEIKNTQN